jgi:hypothetical protein
MHLSKFYFRHSALIAAELDGVTPEVLVVRIGSHLVFQHIRSIPLMMRLTDA